MRKLVALLLVMSLGGCGNLGATEKSRADMLKDGDVEVCADPKLQDMILNGLAYDDQLNAEAVKVFTRNFGRFPPLQTMSITARDPSINEITCSGYFPDGAGITYKLRPGSASEGGVVWEFVTPVAELVPHASALVNDWNREHGQTTAGAQ